MPADKLPPTVGATATFTAGEQPSATKLSLIGTQLRAATQSLERAIGDLRGQRVPYVSGGEPDQTKHLAVAWGRSRTTGITLTGAVPRPVDIVSIARFLGPSSVLNPRNLETNNMSEAVPAGVYAFDLQYPSSAAATHNDPAGNTVFADSALEPGTFSSTDTGLTNYVNDLSLLASAGDWTFDVVHGIVYSYEPTVGDGTFTYPVNPEAFGGGYNYPGARFNVIPDPNQMADGPYLTVTGPTDGRYQIDLPVVDEYQGDIIAGSISASTSQHGGAQIKLPACLDGFTAETEIPSGFVMLKHTNPSTGAVTIYEEATYFYMSQTQVLVGGVTLPNTNGDEYQIVTVGTDIVTSIDDLRIKSRHAHDRSFGEPLVGVQDLTGQYSGSTPILGRVFPSQLATNFFPQYVHREGWSDGVDSLNQDNGMFRYLRFMWDNSLPWTDPNSFFSRGIRWQGGSATQDVVLSFLIQTSGTPGADTFSLFRETSLGDHTPSASRDTLNFSIYANTYLMDDVFISKDTGTQGIDSGSPATDSHKLFFADDTHWIRKEEGAGGAAQNLVANTSDGFKSPAGFNPHDIVAAHPIGGGAPIYLQETLNPIRTGVYSGSFTTGGSPSAGTVVDTILTSCPVYDDGAHTGGLIVGVSLMVADVLLGPYYYGPDNLTAPFYWSVRSDLNPQQISILDNGLDASKTYGWVCTVWYIEDLG